MVKPHNLGVPSSLGHDRDRSIGRVASLVSNQLVQLLMVVGSSARSSVDLLLVLSVPQLVLLGIVGGPHRVFGSSGDIGLLLHLLDLSLQLRLDLLLTLALSLGDLCSRELLVTLPVLNRRESVRSDLLAICLPVALPFLLLPLFGLLLL